MFDEHCRRLSFHRRAQPRQRRASNCSGFNWRVRALATARPKQGADATVTANAIAITAIAHPPAQNHWYKLPLTAARQSVLRLVGKGRWRNEDCLRAAFGQAIQSRAEKDKR